ncbi:MAG: MarR family transcriptional regulator [Solirubrobacterales bacterium]|nr:MarR family transcriptional regulator [Solirubrobacterales bacterium]MBV9166723.1 MarR family transcriptional regulator [Solirubrobacterales bacterium]MBV9535861.1 MarR family transcriptional regulator [Solirubrobacterales bacterium]
MTVSDFKPFVAPPGTHRALVKHTGFLLARMGHVAARRFSERIAELGVTARMWGALNVLEVEGPTTQQFLGKCTGIDPSSMVATIDDLEARGLVERRPHPSDRRAHALHLTEQGREVLGRGRQVARTAEDDLLAPLSPEDRKTLHELLLRLALAAEEPAPGRGRRDRF